MKAIWYTGIGVVPLVYATMAGAGTSAADCPCPPTCCAGGATVAEERTAGETDVPARASGRTDAAPRDATTRTPRATCEGGCTPGCC